MNSSKPTVYFDDIIFTLQSVGGVSGYWQQVTTAVAEKAVNFKVRRTTRRVVFPYLERYLPVFSRAQIFHSSYFRFNLNPFSKNIITIYDFMYELGYLKSKGSFINIFHKKIAIWQADVIICISENTKNDLFKIYPNLCQRKEVEVIYLDSSLSGLSNMSLNGSEIEEFTNTSQYILFVGKRSSYKNFDAISQAFAESKLSQKGFMLVCVGSPFSRSEEKRLLSLGIFEQTTNFCEISSSELEVLYRKAFTLVYPSLYEGFGLPLLEAMKCGCPVIASNTSSIPEVVGHAGILIDPNDVHEIVSALEKLLDSSIRERYIALGFRKATEFSWAKAVQQHIDIYESLI